MRHAAAADGAPTTVTTDRFTVDVTGSNGGTVRKTVTVPIGPLNGVPTGGAVTGVQLNEEVGFVTGSVTGVSDPDHDALTFTAAPVTTGGGSVEVNPDGSFTYIPTFAQRQAAAADGAPFDITHDAFSITANDGHGGTRVINVTVTVPPDNSSPTGVAAG
jgi:VCBS repeat-containing protein